VRIAIGLAALALAASCSNDDRHVQCEKIRDGVNHAARKMDAAPTVQGTGAEIARTAKQQGDIMQEVHDALAAVELSDGTLRGLMKQLADVAGQKVANLRKLQAAGEADDHAAYEAGKTEGLALNDAEDAITDQIVAYCQQ